MLKRGDYMSCNAEKAHAAKFYRERRGVLIKASCSEQTHTEHVERSALA